MEKKKRWWDFKSLFEALLWEEAKEQAEEKQAEAQKAEEKQAKDQKAEEQQAEKRQTGKMTGLKKGMIALALGALLLYGAIGLFYLTAADVNKTQLLSLLLSGIVLLGAGAAFVCCASGTLPAAGRVGGQAIFYGGMALVFINGSLGLLSKYYFGRFICFWDFAVLLLFAYYLACNTAWCAFQKRPRFRFFWIAASGLLLLAVVFSPAVLGFQMYSAQVMGEAERIAEEEREALLEEKTTPEFLEFKQWKEQWLSPEEYAMVYTLSLEAGEFSHDASHEPAFEKAGVFVVRKADREIRVIFTLEDGKPVIIESHRLEEMTGDMAKVEYYCVDGVWYSHDDFLPLHQKHTPGFEMEKVAQYQNLVITRGGEARAEGCAEILEEESDGKRSLTYVYEEEYLDRQGEAIRQLGIDPGSHKKQWEKLTADEDGAPVERHTYEESLRNEMDNFVKKEWTQIEERKSRYVTTDSQKVRELYDDLAERGPSVPKEAVALYEAMWK